MAGLLAWALSIQRPWRAPPLPVTDMGGILTMLRGAPSIPDATALLVQSAALEGRFMPGSMLALAVKVQAFDSGGADWRWASFVVSGALLVAAYLVLRRFGVKPLGAFAGASLFIYGDHASPAWLLPQVMEPVAALLVIAAVALALQYRATVSPARQAILISLCLMAAIWVKEPVIAAVPFVLLVALCWRQGGWDMRPPGDKVRTMLASAALLIALLNAVPILAVRLVAADPDYASRYSLSTLSIETMSNALRASLLPVTRVPWFPVNVAAAGVVIAGAWTAARQRGTRQALLAVAIPLVLPFSMALIYAPWPSFPGYYALPGTFGLALVLGAALTSVLQGSGRITRVAAIAAYAVMAVLGTVVVNGAVAGYAAERRLESRLARQLRDVRSPAVLAYGVRLPELSGGYGGGLLMYARLFFGPISLRSAVDVSCETAARLAAAAPRDTVVVTYGAECPHVQGEPFISLREPVAARHWKTLRPYVDTIRATVIGAAVPGLSQAAEEWREADLSGGSRVHARDRAVLTLEASP